MSQSTNNRITVRQLPGLYWDEERQRYFPLTSRPSGAAVRTQSTSISANTTPSVRSNRTDAPTVSQFKDVKTHRKDTSQTRLWMMDELRTKPYRFAAATTIRHEIIGHELVSICKLRARNMLYSDEMRVRAPRNMFPSLSCFKFAAWGNDPHLIVGNPNGSLWWSHPSEIDDELPNSTPTARIDEEVRLEDKWRTFEMPYHDTSRAQCNASTVMMNDLVYKICTSEDRCIATTFGSSLHMAVMTFDSERARGREFVISLYNFRKIYDVWSSALYKRSAVLGSRSQITHIPDVDNASQHSHRYTRTKSDVLALHHDRFDIIAGMRSGSIQRFDTRTSETGQELLGGFYKPNAGSSVMWLDVVREWGLLVGTMAGDLDMFDLRFSRNDRPMMRFEGHVNSYHTRLGITTDPSSTFLFAAGADNRIRAWSLHTGQSLTPLISPTPSATSSRPNEVSELSDLTFDEPSRCIQVTEGPHGQGLRLWVMRGYDIEGYGLGRMDSAI